MTSQDQNPARTARRLFTPAIVGALTMGGLSLVAARHRLGAGKLVAPKLLAAPNQLGQAWAHWGLQEPGMPGSNAPWLGVAALGSTLTAGQPQLFTKLLVLGAVAFAGWSAYLFFTRVLGRSWLAVLLGALWGSLLAVAGAVSNGALDAIVVAIVLPLLGTTWLGWLRGPANRWWSGPARAGLLIGVVTAFIPMFYLVGFAGVAIVAIRRRDVRGGLLATLSPLVLVAPWLPRLLAQPGRMLTGFDPGVFGAAQPPGMFDVWLGWGLHTATPPVVSAVVFVALWGVALFAASRGLRPVVRVVLLLGAVGANVIGTALAKTVVTIWGTPVRPDPTPWTVLSLFCLVSLAGFGVAPRRHSLEWTSGPRLVAVIGVVAMIATSWWVIAGVDAPLRAPDALVPGFVQDAQQSERQTRTLLVDMTSSQARFNLMSAAQPTWGQGEIALLTSIDAADEVREVAQQVAGARPGDDLVKQLNQLAIGHIWVRGASPETIAKLSDIAGLRADQVDAKTTVLALDPQPARLMVRHDDTLTPLTGDRQLADGDVVVLAQPAGGWQASLDGRALTTVESGDWRQAWQVNQAGTSLVVRQGVDWLGIMWEGLVLAGLTVLAAPRISRLVKRGPRRD